MKEKSTAETWSLFVIPHFHFDVAWIKTHEEYLQIGFSNILDVLNLIEQEPEYRFCLDQVALIQPFWEKFPELQETLRRMVKDGKIELVCGMYSMPDANIPSGEFLVRQFLFGKRFVKEKFGVDVRCGWMVDSFGHPNQLPQILHKSGLKYYVFGRGAPPQQVQTEFYWEGLDGSKILTHWLAGTYIAGWVPSPSGEIISKIGEELPYITRVLLRIQSLRWLPVPLEKGIAKIDGIFQLFSKFASTRNIFFPNGADFTPPQRQMPLFVREWNKRKKNVKAVISTPSNFFKAVEAAKERLPTVSGEFNPVFQGVYGARIKLKQKNREAENLLLTAEKFTTISSVIGAPYPDAELNEATKSLLFNHFHDIICGCGIDEVYENAMRRFEESMKTANKILKKSLEFITNKIDTYGKGTPIVVFNPLSWTRTDVAEADISFIEPYVKDFTLKDHIDNPIPFQILEEERYPNNSVKHATIKFIAEDVPAIGYKTYFVLGKKHARGEKPRRFETDVKAGVNRIENEFFNVTVDPLHGGAIESIYDKEKRREALDTDRYLGNVLVSESDVGDLYEYNGSANGYATSDTLRVDPLPTAETAEFSSNHPAFTFIETGPVEAKITISGQMKGLTYEQVIRLYHKIRRVDLKLNINFHGEHKRIRLCLPLNIKDGNIYHEVPYGIIERGEGEYPAQNWIDYSDKQYGVGLINRGLPGNNVTKNVAFLTLLRSVDRVLFDHPSGSGALERGKHEFAYAVYPHKGEWEEAKTFRTAMEFNSPLIVIKTTRHKGDLPKEQSFLSVTPENIIVTAVKMSDEDVLIRFYETAGEKTSAKITPFKPIKKAWTTSLLEERLKELKTAAGKNIFMNVERFEIATVAVSL